MCIRDSYGVPAGQVVVVTFTVALFTATPMACFLVYVMTKAEAMRAELAGSYEILFKEREVQADTLVRLRVAHDRARRQRGKSPVSREHGA